MTKSEIDNVDSLVSLIKAVQKIQRQTQTTLNKLNVIAEKLNFTNQLNNSDDLYQAVRRI